MDLVLKGRGVRLTDQVRRSAEQKLGKLERLDSRVGRVEVEIADQNPRVGASHRVEVACALGRHHFRAEGLGQDLEAALDQALQRLERQITSRKGKMRNRPIGRGNRLQSRRTSPEGSSPET